MTDKDKDRNSLLRFFRIVSLILDFLSALGETAFKQFWHLAVTLLWALGKTAFKTFWQLAITLLGALGKTAFNQFWQLAVTLWEPGETASNTVWQLVLTNKPDIKPKFKIRIYEDELENIHEWVLKHENIETGGDLFGLWIDEHTAVVQLVVGPGKNCRRTTTSFYQDLEYLGKTGDEIVNKYGLCNIGQWHSHHRLALPKPSTGDENTVWGNMPDLGMQRYVVCIATISGQIRHPEVKVHPFLFEIGNDGQREIIKGDFEILNSPHSPLRQNRDVLDILKDGAESMNVTKTAKSFNSYVNIQTITEHDV